MKTGRILLASLCSAASLTTAGGAMAADLPIKAKAVEYVRVCSLYGAGFFYIPGTDTCIKLGGYLRVDTTFNGGPQGQPAWNGDLGARDRYADYYATRSRMAFNIDTRTQTEYGTVRTFGQADFQFSTLGGSTFNPNSLNTNLGNNPQLLDSVGGGYVSVEYVFIQFAGFTFGKSASAYASPWQGFPGNNSSFLLGGQNTDTGVNNIQYTAQFGNGVSASIGLDDATVWDRTSLYNLSQPGSTAGSSGMSAVGTMGNAYGGVQSPDIVGNVRIDQAWGLFQVSAAAHEVNGSYNLLGANAAPVVGSETSGHPETKWGGSVMVALNVKNLPTGVGDDIKIDASYAKGDTKNVIATSSTSPSFAMFGSSSRGYQSIGFGATTDGVYSATSGIELTDAFGVRGAFNHNWDPNWSTSLYGSASFVRYDGAAKSAYCLTYAKVATNPSADFSCNPNFNVYQVGVVTRWTPVKNLTFSAEVQYFRLDQDFSGTATINNPPAPKPAAVYEYRDQDTVLVQARVQRNF